MRSFLVSGGLLLLLDAAAASRAGVLAESAAFVPQKRHRRTGFPSTAPVRVRSPAAGDGGRTRRRRQSLTAVAISDAATQQQPETTTATTLPNVKEERVAKGASASSSTSPPSLLELLQQRAAPIASSFRTEDEYDPLIRNGHLQTILPFLIRDDPDCNYVSRSESPLAAFGRVVGRKLRKKAEGADEGGGEGEGEGDFFWDVRERIDTPDGDWFHADTKYAVGRGDTTSAPTVILLHGLQSNSNSSLSQELARGFNMQGMHCVCLNFRGCSGQMNDKFGGYHLGFTDDLIQYLQLLRQRQREQSSSGSTTGTTTSAKRPPLYLAGFSLGANAVLKCLGELGERAYLEYGIDGAAVSGAPFDQTKNYKVLAEPGSINRLVYTNNLLRSLKQRLVDQWDCLYEKYPDVPIDFDAAMSARTIPEYEDEVIAPIYGFDNYIDYYDKTSCMHFLDTIAVPTLIVNADDDPFFDPSVWPTDKSRVHGDGPAPVRMVRTRSGGHLGFGFHQVDDGDERLTTISRRCGEKKLAGGGDDDDDSDGAPWPSWASWELARFLNHVQEEHEDLDELLLLR